MTPQSLGFPPIRKTCPPLSGQPVSWIPGVRTDAGNWRLLLWHSGDLRGFADAGGDLSTGVIHWLSCDTSIINPMWRKTSFLRRIEHAKSIGVTKCIGPDFSSWADMPIASQIYNYYRSAAVCHDLAAAGFDLIPNVCWSAPQLHAVSIQMWGKVDFALVDANHFSPFADDYNAELFWLGADEFNRTNPGCRVWVYSTESIVADQWRARYGGDPVWCPSRLRMVRELSQRRKLKCPRELEEAAEAFSGSSRT